MSFLNDCGKELLQVLNMTYISQSTSLKMIQSWGAGEGDLGEYDDCVLLNLDPTVKTSGESVRYCWVGTSVNAAAGLCVPHVCSDNRLMDQITLLEKDINRFGKNASGLHAQCTTSDNTISFFGQLAVCVTVLLLLLVLLASVDAWSAELRKWYHRGWVCFDKKEQARAERFISNPVPLNTSYRATPRKPNQDSDSDDDATLHSMAPISLGNAAHEQPQQQQRSLSGTTTPVSHSKTRVNDDFFLQAFSIRSNYRHLMSRDRHPLAPLHAMRVMATVWIVLGNTVAYMVPVLKESNGLSLIMNVEHNWAAQWVIGSYFAVDIFFVLSGFMAGHSFLVQLKAINRIGPWKPIRRLHYGFIDIPQMYLYRFCRIVPSLAFVMLVFVGLTDLTNPGPLHFLYEDDYIDPCRKHWWTNVLLINNFYPPSSAAGKGNVCMDWTWYLATDFNMYLVAPLFVLLFWKHRPLGWGVVTLTLVASTAFSTYLGMLYQYSMNPFKHYGRSTPFIYDAYNFAGYNKPWTRCVPYLMGLAAAMTFHEYGARIKLNRCFVITGLFSVIVLFLFIVFIAPVNYFAGIEQLSINVTALPSGSPADVIHQGSYYGNPNWSILMCTVYSVFSHVIIGASTTFVLFVFATGHGGFLRRLTKFYFWTPLSRLCFGVYLIHPILITSGYSGAYSLQFYEPLTAVTSWIAMTVLSFIGSFVLYMLVEKPFKQCSTVLLRKLCCRLPPPANSGKGGEHNLEEGLMSDDSDDVFA